MSWFSLTLNVLKMILKIVSFVDKGISHSSFKILIPLFWLNKLGPEILVQNTRSIYIQRESPPSTSFGQRGSIKTFHRVQTQVLHSNKWNN